MLEKYLSFADERIKTEVWTANKIHSDVIYPYIYIRGYRLGFKTSRVFLGFHSPFDESGPSFNLTDHKPIYISSELGSGYKNKICVFLSLFKCQY